MRLAAAHVSYCGWIKSHRTLYVGRITFAHVRSKEAASRSGLRIKGIAYSIGPLQHVAMRRQLRNRNRVRLLAASFAERVTTADVNRHAPAQIGQAEINAPVA